MALRAHGLYAGDSAVPVDQAAGLRHLLGEDPSRQLRVLPVAGGAQAGHSAIVACLAAHAAATERVVVLDQTNGEVARHLGLTTHHDLFDVVSGRLEFDRVAVRAGAWRLLPAQRGLARLLAQGLPSSTAIASGATEETETVFFESFLHLREPATLLLVNLDDQQVWKSAARQGGTDLLLVTTPAPASMTAAYARLKQWGSYAGGSGGAGAVAGNPTATMAGTIRVLVNGANGYADARRVYRTLADTARNFLGVETAYAGYLPPDRADAPFGCSRRAAVPACEKALVRLTASIQTWRLAQYGVAAARQIP